MLSVWGWHCWNSHCSLGWISNPKLRFRRSMVFLSAVTGVSGPAVHVGAHAGAQAAAKEAVPVDPSALGEATDGGGSQAEEAALRKPDAAEAKVVSVSFDEPPNVVEVA